MKVSIGRRRGGTSKTVTHGDATALLARRGHSVQWATPGEIRALPQVAEQYDVVLIDPPVAYDGVNLSDERVNELIKQLALEVPGAEQQPKQ